MFTKVFHQEDHTVFTCRQKCFIRRITPCLLVDKSVSSGGSHTVYVLTKVFYQEDHTVFACWQKCFIRRIVLCLHVDKSVLSGGSHRVYMLTKVFYQDDDKHGENCASALFVFSRTNIYTHDKAACQWFTRIGRDVKAAIGIIIVVLL